MTFKVGDIVVRLNDAPAGIFFGHKGQAARITSTGGSSQADFIVQLLAPTEHQRTSSFGTNPTDWRKL